MNYSKIGIALFFFIGFFLMNKSLAQESRDSVSFASYDSIHSPKKATILAAIIPSLGHIYNDTKRLPIHKSHLWWKLPLIYGGLGATGYLVVSNHQQFKAFKQERINRLDAAYNPLLGSYWLYADFQLQQIQEKYRKWRDLSVIATLGVYLLQLIDANVEAHLMHFDMSDDLTLEFIPTLNWSPYQNNAFWGGTIRIAF